MSRDCRRFHTTILSSLVHRYHWLHHADYPTPKRHVVAVHHSVGGAEQALLCRPFDGGTHQLRVRPAHGSWIPAVRLAARGIPIQLSVIFNVNLFGKCFLYYKFYLQPKAIAHVGILRFMFSFPIIYRTKLRRTVNCSNAGRATVSRHRDRIIVGNVSKTLRKRTLFQCRQLYYMCIIISIF